MALEVCVRVYEVGVCASSLALSPEGSCALGSGGVMEACQWAAVEKGKCRHARAERWRPRPAHRISVDDGGLNGLPRRGTHHRTARSVRIPRQKAVRISASHTPQAVSVGELCVAYAIVPVWFARFAVRARSKLGLTCERKTGGVSRYALGGILPLHDILHCTW